MYRSFYSFFSIVGNNNSSLPYSPALFAVCFHQNAAHTLLAEQMNTVYSGVQRKLPQISRPIVWRCVVRWWQEIGGCRESVSSSCKVRFGLLRSQSLTNFQKSLRSWPSMPVCSCVLSDFSVHRW